MKDCPRLNRRRDGVFKPRLEERDTQGDSDGSSGSNEDLNENALS